ncbi:uncharacterized protein LOC101855888 [Aplysia californica]|uniref:Uncharacterized protein LOC101855888 n=1 Tax=Aplysia californica TaxID=6500 RepID=A0ABM1A5D2_APLCA|nr:uncharacterized protein LOC101855888 [Aplysia californica]
MDVILACYNFDPDAKSLFNKTPLFLTARKGYTYYVEELLFMCANVDQQDPQGVTPLSACCYDDFHEAAEELIRYNAELDTPDVNGETPLFRACSHVSVNCVRVLTENGCDVNIANKKSGLTPLMVALPPLRSSRAWKKKKITDMLEICRMLIKAGCDVDAQDFRGRTALHHVVDKKDVHGLCLLAENGCNLEVCDENRRTPFQKALYYTMPVFEICRFLVYFGAYCRKEYMCYERSDEIKALSTLAWTMMAAPREKNPDKLREQFLLLRVLREATYPYPGGFHSGLVVEQLDKNPTILDQYKTVERETEDWMRSRVPASLQFQARLKLREMLGVRNTLCRIDSLPIGKDLKRYLKLSLEEELPLSRSCMLHVYIKDVENKKLKDLVQSGANVNFKVDGKTPLATAISLKNLEACRILLSSSVASMCQNAVNVEGDTPLHFAAACGFIDVIDDIIQAGGTVKALNKNNFTPLRSAVTAGHFEIASLLIKRGAEVKGQETMTVPLLHLAAASRNIEVVKMMLERGVEANLRDDEMNTPLHIVASQARIYLRKQLYLPALHKSDLEATQETSDTDVSSSETTPTIPGKEKYRDIARLLLEHGADVLVYNSEFLTPLEVAEEGDDPVLIDIFLGLPESQSPKAAPSSLIDLHKAIWVDNNEEARKLIQSGADINTVHEHETVFTLAVEFENFEIMDEIMARHDFDPMAKNVFGRTPLFVTAKKGFTRYVEELSSMCTHVNQKDINGVTPLRACCWGDYHETAKVLISHGADLNNVDNDGETPLYGACVRTSVNCVREFLANGCQVDMPGKSGVTPLMMALPPIRNFLACENHKISDMLEICQMLIDAGCDLDAQDSRGRTALHYAVDYGDVFGLCLLAENGCNLEVSDENHRTPFQNALFQTTPAFEIARFLVYYGANCREEIEVYTYGKTKVKSPLAWAIEAVPLGVQPDKLRERYLLLKVLREAAFPYLGGLSSSLALPQMSKKPHLVDEYRAVEREIVGWMCSQVPASLLFQTRLKFRETLGVRNTLSRIDSLPIRSYLIKGYLKLGLGKELPSSRSCMLHVYIKDGENKKLEDLVQSGANVNFEVNGKTPLATAIILQNVEAFRILFSTGLASIGQNPVNKEGDTPFHVAAACGLINIIDDIIHAGGSVNAPNKKRCTPLHSAVTAGHFEVASLLIRRGAKVKDQETLSFPLLHLAAANHNTEIVEMMLERGVKANLRDQQGNTPLHIVASQANIYLELNLPALSGRVARPTIQDKKKYRDVARLLLAHGAEQVMVYNSESLTPLDVAEKGDDPVLIDILKNRCASGISPDGGSSRAGWNQPTSELCGHYTQMFTPDKSLGIYTWKMDLPESQSAKAAPSSLIDLHKAIWDDKNKEARKLIKSGADINTVHENETAFTLAVEFENFEIMDEIMARHDFDPMAKNVFGRTPLFVTAKKGFTCYVKDLEILSTCPSIDHHDINGATPLSACCWGDHHETAEELISNGADLDNVDNDGETPLYGACIRTSINCVRVLIQKGCQVNLPGKSGVTPLMMSLPPIGNFLVCENHKISDMLEMCQMLIDAGCDLDAQDSTGRTALHYAVDYKDVFGVCLLAENGCNLEVSDVFPQTPFQSALFQTMPAFEIARLLVYYGANCREEILACSLGNTEVKSPLAWAIEAAPLGAQPDKLRERYFLLKVLKEATYPYPGGLSSSLVLPQVSKNPHLVDPYRAIERKTSAWMRSRVPASLQFQVRLKIRDMLGVRNTLSRIDSLPIGEYLKSYLKLNLDLELPLSRSCMLHVYIKDGENKKLENLVRNGAHVNFMVDGKTPLATAVILKNLEAFKIVFSSKIASIGHHPVNNEGDTALHLAAAYGLINIIDDIILAGGSVKAHNKKRYTPLHSAVTAGHFEVASLLIRRGAEVKGQETLGYPLIHLAAASHNIEVVEMMLKRGVAANLRDQKGNTPLHIVASHANIYINLELNLPALSGRTARPTTQDKEKYQDIARLLLAHGAEVRAYNTESFTPMDVAEKGDDPVLVDILKSGLLSFLGLLSMGADVDQQDVQGVTPLGACCWDDFHETSKELIRYKAKMNTPDVNGGTPLFRACAYVSVNCVRVLTENGCDVNIASKRFGLTPLMVALPSLRCSHVCKKKKISDTLEICQMLIKAGCDVDAQDFRGRTALHHVVDNRDVFGLCLLAENGCNLEVCDEKCRTPFQKALFDDRPAYEAARFLVYYGANCREEIEVHCNGKTEVKSPLAWAMETILQADHRYQIYERHLLLRVLRKATYPYSGGLSSTSLSLPKMFESLDFVHLYMAFDNETVDWMHSSVAASLQFQAQLKLREMLGVRNTLSRIDSLPVGKYLKRHLMLGLEEELPLSRSCMVHVYIRDRENRKLEVMVENGAYVNIMVGGFTPLGTAIREKNLEAFRILVSKSKVASICQNPVSVEGDTPLHAAASFGFIDVIGDIIQAGGSVKALNKLRYTPLHCAVIAGHFEVASLLIRRGAEVKGQETLGYPLLHLAAGSRNTEVVEMMLERGVEANLRDHQGNTPLHIVASQANIYLNQQILLPALYKLDELCFIDSIGTIGSSREARPPIPGKEKYRDVARLLLEHGANIRTYNSESLTPLDVAEKGDDPVLIDILKKRV